MPVVWAGNRLERYKCRTIEEVLELFDRLEDSRVSTIIVKRLEGKK